MASSHHAPRISIGMTFGLTLAGMIVMTAGLVLLVSYRSSHSAMLDYSRSLIDHNAESVREQVGEFLGPTRSAAELSLRVVQRGLVDAHDLASLEAFFFDFLSVYGTVGTLSFGNANGEFVMVMRQADGALWTKMIRGVGDAREVVWRQREPGGPLDPPARLVPDPADTYDPRTRPWYVGADRAGGLHWTDVYIFHTGNVPGLTAAVPWSGTGGELHGVLSVDVSLVDLSRFVGRMRVGKSGETFVIDQQGRVIAWPDVDALTLPVAADDGGMGTRRLRKLSECDSTPVVALAMRPELAAFMAGKAATGVNVSYDQDDATWVGALQPIVVDPEHPWLVGVVALENEFLAEAKAATARSAILATTLAGLALALGLALAGVVIARSLKRLAEESKRIQMLDFSSVDPPVSRFRELQEVFDSYEAMKVGLRAFQRYMPVKLVRTLLEEHAEPTLGGTSKELTILFSDIRNFTTLAEVLAPDELAQRLGDYLGVVTRNVRARSGTVDKYIGDCVMAFWGAPHPVEHHGREACAAALDALDAIADLQAGDPTAPDMYTRIGIHTAEVVVGNFGSEDRLNYTLAGDGVNLASRLEGLNKVFGTQVLITESTRLLVAGEFETRRVGLVAVKGRGKAVLVHELLGRAGEVDPARLDRARRYEQAHHHYLERRWEEAIALFEALAGETPDDLAVARHLEMCRDFLDQGPGDDWTGAITMHTK